MKVRVSYTAMLDQVPDIVEKLLSECRENLLSQCDNLKGGMHDVPSFLVRLTEVRNNMALIDSQLEDLTGMASGWHDASREPLPEAADAAKEEVNEEMLPDATD